MRNKTGFLRPGIRPVPGRRPHRAPSTSITLAGSQPKVRGVLGLYKGAKPETPANKYTIVQMSEDYFTPEDQAAGNPIEVLF